MVSQGNSEGNSKGNSLGIPQIVDLLQYHPAYANIQPCTTLFSENMLYCQSVNVECATCAQFPTVIASTVRTINSDSCITGTHTYKLHHSSVISCCIIVPHSSPDCQYIALYQSHWTKLTSLIQHSTSHMVSEWWHPKPTVASLSPLYHPPCRALYAPMADLSESIFR